MSDPDPKLSGSANAGSADAEPADAGSADAMISKADGLKYWNSVNADVDGMLGGIPSLDGYSFVSRVDLQGSRSFLAKLGIGTRNGRQKVANALEGGAGLVSNDS